MPPAPCSARAAVDSCSDFRKSMSMRDTCKHWNASLVTLATADDDYFSSILPLSPSPWPYPRPIPCRYLPTHILDLLLTLTLHTSPAPLPVARNCAASS